MARDFVGDFLLPLVRGGTLHVGRPIGRRALELTSAVRARRAPTPPVLELAAARRAIARTVLGDAPAPPLDAATLRFGAAVHNLLALAHPRIEGRGMERRQLRIAQAAEELASLGPPASVGEAVNRHSLLSRLPEIVRADHTVHFWLGQRSYVGRPPPPRIVALPRLRGVRVSTLRRNWLREIGIPPVARPALLSLYLASPLGEALDPMRLDPPPSWGRIIPVLRFPALCRITAGRVVELGVGLAGGALAGALFRFASLQEAAGQLATPEAVAFAVRFLAHAFWLHVLFAPSPESSTPMDLAASQDLAAVLVAAEDVAPSLLWPPDTGRESEVGRLFADRIAGLRAQLRLRGPERLQAATAVCRFAVTSPTVSSNV